ncbi:MAG: 1-acyl-sn-glycerol-3-phosphate acyltransferase [Alphaproteobacteria bacterium]|nr:1-acyl-sn-glycerol-3-phosphate acyltransferase [Alphaproteobacteria bacterium]MCW5743319.1 1-acyl-sn-glycerol-3-phosphate acyltransferase [Alphaproteobacteria bacterium]
MKSSISAENRAFREAAPSLGSSGRATFRLITYAILTLTLIPVQALAVLLRVGPVTRGLPYCYHRLVCLILGLKIEVRGTRSTESPTLYVGNHVSYLDIETLGSTMPCSFVAKAEVATWPFFSVLAKLQRTVFVERRTRATRESRDSIIGRLESGDSLILFPEGTSSDGTRVLPFRSALFAVAQVTPGGKPLRVQPFTVAYTRLDGIPLGRYWRPYFTWYGDMELAGHLWNVCKLGECSVVIQFHEPVDITMFGDRKKLSDHCFRVCSQCLQAINRGEPARPLPKAAE